MRAAQPVEVPLGAGRRGEVAMALGWALAVVVFGAWLAGREDWPTSVRGLGLGVVALMAVGAWRGSRPMSGRLDWDGSGWTWLERESGSAFAAPGLRIALDGGSWLVLRDDPGRWCVVARADARDAWHPLRLALHAGHEAADRGPQP